MRTSPFPIAPVLLVLAWCAPVARADEGGGGDPLPRMEEFVRRAAPDQGPEFAPRYAEGVAALRAEKWDEAAIALGRAALESPTDPRAHLLQCVAHLGSSRFDLAARAARRTFAVYPLWSLEDFDLTRILGPEVAKTYGTRLEPELMKAVAAKPSDPDLALLVVLLQHGAGKRVTARENLARTLAAFPDHRPSRQLHAAYEPGGSRPPWRTVGPEDRPDDPMVRGIHLLWIGEPQRAAAAFAEATALDPAAAAPRIELGHALFAASRYPLAGRVLLDGVGRMPEPARRDFDLFDRFAEAEGLDGRMAELEDYVRANPSDFESLFLFAYALFHTERPAQALPLFDLLAKGRPGDALLASYAAEARRRKDGAPAPAAGAGGTPDPRSGDGLVQAGTLAFKNGRYDESLRLFEEAVRLDAARSQYHFWLALSRFAVGRFAGAGLAFRDGMKHVTDWKTFAFDWSGSYGSTQDYKTQLDLLQKYSKANPNDADSRLFLGVQLLSRRDYAGAITAFEQNRQVDSGDTLSWELERRARDEARRGRY